MNQPNLSDADIDAAYTEIWRKNAHLPGSELARMCSRAAIAADRERRGVVGWISVQERMPANGVTVLACYRNSMGNVRRIRACWVAAMSSESSPESEIGEYDEATDTYYDPEGWYEQIDNWDEYTAVTVHGGEITHWMPLPPAPDHPGEVAP